jgi:hypothetical protein
VRGGDNRTGKLFSYVDLEDRVRRDHPLRAIRTIVNEALSALEREFAGLYSPIGRPSIPPEKLQPIAKLVFDPHALAPQKQRGHPANRASISENTASTQSTVGGQTRRIRGLERVLTQSAG